MPRIKKERKIPKKKKRLTMEQIAKLPSVREMWEPWDVLAKELIPEDFTQQDALEGSLQPNLVNDDWVRDRMEYLSDRADPARTYWLDWAIRILLKKPLRENQ